MTEFDPQPGPDPSQKRDLWSAREKFVNYKYDTQKDSTARAYKYPTKSMIQYARSQGVTTTGEITPGLVNGWVDQRRDEVKTVTAHNNARHIRVFLKFLGQRDLTGWEVHQKVDIPDLKDQEEVNDTWLEESEAAGILDYLDTFHYATLYHAVFFTAWRTACRVSGIIALDLDDFDPKTDGTAILRFRDRPETGTALKNGKNGQRNVTIYSEELVNVLNAYVDQRRADTTDEYDREPLFATPTKRIYRQLIYKNVNAVSRPCVYGTTCPHDREISECEPAQYKKKSFSCPSSISTHPIRKGALSDHLNRGWTYEDLSQRADVSPEVLEKHYDMRSEEKKRQARAKRNESNN